MSINSKLTSLADNARKVSGVKNKLSIDDITSIIGKLIAFEDHGNLPENVDLNKIIDAGTYDVSLGQNKPINNWGTLVVLRAGTRTIQIYIADNGKSYVRSGVGYNSFAYNWQSLGGS